MRVRVRLFAGTRDAVGAPSVDVDVPPGATVGDLVGILCARHPRLEGYRGHALLALDGAFTSPRAALREGAEVALMPPVSGGSDDGRALVDGPFSLDALVASLERRGAGAVVAFLGQVRPTSGEAPGMRVERLRFEAYEALAEAEVARLRDEAARTFGLTGCLVRHRLGVLAVDEPIVAVVCAAPHRREAFEAAQWLMDRLKTSVPIWKREEGPAGARWVNDPTSTGAPHA
jgi:molybdopterin synthase catalytic subunit